jgi:CubicO group peptidase (beta-lactamase class C family)
MKLNRFLATAAALWIVALPSGSFGQPSIKQVVSSAEKKQLAQFEVTLDKLREDRMIPAISAAIVKNRKVLWARGFGYADLEQKIPATEHTAYHLASLTKTFASTIVMQLLKEGKVRLDDPVTNYGIALPSEGVIRVKHLLSHTSQGNPGERYQYSGDRFGRLDKVILQVTGRSFADLLFERIIEPLGLDETAPNVPPQAIVPEPDDPAVKEIKEAMEELRKAYNDGNADALAQFYVPNNSVFRDDGAVLDYNQEAYIGGALRAGYKVSVETFNIRVARVGSTVFSTSYLQGTLTPPNGTPTRLGPSRVTYVWVQDNGKWKIAHTHQSELNGTPISEKRLQRFEEVSQKMALPYELRNQGGTLSPVRGSYPTFFGTAAGLITTLLDMAKYDIALDQNKLLDQQTQQLAWTPTISTKGETLPYGLGWFIQDYYGIRLIWHYGYWNCNSSLIVKVPHKNLTFIVMANTDALSRATTLGANEDMTSSPMGLAFLEQFVLPDVFGEPLPTINWKGSSDEVKATLERAMKKKYADVLKTELKIQRMTFSSVGKTEESKRMARIYMDLYGKKMPAETAKARIIAKIDRVRDSEDRTEEFRLDSEQRVRIFVLGEGILAQGEMADYGFLEDSETGKTVWQMKASESLHAGGAEKNRMVDTVVTLPAGKYRLRYKSDDSHSYDSWNADPPDYDFWGIAIYSVE